MKYIICECVSANIFLIPRAAYEYVYSIARLGAHVEGAFIVGAVGICVPPPPVNHTYIECMCMYYVNMILEQQMDNTCVCMHDKFWTSCLVSYKYRFDSVPHTHLLR